MVHSFINFETRACTQSPIDWIALFFSVLMPKIVEFYLARHAEWSVQMLAKNKQNEAEKNVQNKSERYFIDGPSMTADTVIIIARNDRMNQIIERVMRFFYSLSPSLSSNSIQSFWQYA